MLFVGARRRNGNETDHPTSRNTRYNIAVVRQHSRPSPPPYRLSMLFALFLRNNHLLSPPPLPPSPLRAVGSVFTTGKRVDTLPAHIRNLVQRNGDWVTAAVSKRHQCLGTDCARRGRYEQAGGAGPCFDSTREVRPTRDRWSAQHSWETPNFRGASLRCRLFFSCFEG